jgi:hypothetical protein
MIEYDCSTHYSLIHNTLNMLGFNPSIPNPLTRQRMRGAACLHLGRNVYNHVSSIFVTPDMTDQSNMGMLRAVSGIAVPSGG